MNLGDLNPKAVAAGLFNPGMALGTAGFAFDQYINYKNFQLQRDQYNYERKLQQQIFAREDNATQRRVADLRAAGLSPVLAAGSPAGSGAVVSTTAPQIGKTGLPESALMMMQMVKMKKDIDVSDAQIDLIKSQTENTTNQTKIATEMMPSTQDAQVAAAQSSRASAALSAANARKAIVDALNAELSRVGGNDSISSMVRSLVGAPLSVVEQRNGGVRLGGRVPLYRGQPITRRMTVNGREVTQTLQNNGQWR